MKRPSVLSLFDKTGNMVQPWLRNGYDATIVDLQHPQSGVEKTPYGTKLTRVNADVMNFQPDEKTNWACMFGFPPCTDLSASGARWWKQKGPQALAQALALYDRAREIGEQLGIPYMLENPVGRLSTNRGKPTAYFHPHQYAGYLDDYPDIYPVQEGDHRDRYTKKTGIWTGGGFQVPPQKDLGVDPRYADYIHKQSPGPERANIRSVTPRGFAEAVFLANQNKFYKAWINALNG